MNYHDDYEDDGFLFLMEIIAGVLGCGFALFLLAIFAKIAVDIWTGGCII